MNSFQEAADSIYRFEEDGDDIKVYYYDKLIGECAVSMSGRHEYFHTGCGPLDHFILNKITYKLSTLNRKML